MNNAFFAGSEAFVAVVRHGSVTAGAEALKLSKAAVSQRLSDFEESLGLTLLERTTRAQRLTTAGERVFAACADAVDAVGEARSQLLVDAKDVRGRLAIAGPSTFLSLAVVPAIPGFQQQYPHIDVALCGADWAVDFAAEDIDIGFRIGSTKSRQLVYYNDLYTTRRVLCASKTFLAHSPRRLRTAKDLERTRCIIHKPSGGMWPLRNRRSSRVEKVTPTHTTAVDTMELAVSLAEEGGGVVLLPHYLLLQPLEAGRLTRVLDDWETAAQPIHLVSRRARAFTAPVVAFRRYVAENPRAFDPRLRGNRA